MTQITYETGMRLLRRSYCEDFNAILESSPLKLDCPSRIQLDEFSISIVPQDDFSLIQFSTGVELSDVMAGTTWVITDVQGNNLASGKVGLNGIAIVTRACTADEVFLRLSTVDHVRPASLESLSATKSWKAKDCIDAHFGAGAKAAAGGESDRGEYMRVLPDEGRIDFRVKATNDSCPYNLFVLQLVSKDNEGKHVSTYILWPTGGPTSDGYFEEDVSVGPQTLTDDTEILLRDIESDLLAILKSDAQAMDQLLQICNDKRYEGWHDVIVSKWKKLKGKIDVETR